VRQPTGGAEGRGRGVRARLGLSSTPPSGSQTQRPSINLRIRTRPCSWTRPRQPWLIPRPSANRSAFRANNRCPPGRHATFPSAVRPAGGPPRGLGEGQSLEKPIRASQGGPRLGFSQGPRNEAVPLGPLLGPIHFHLPKRPDFFAFSKAPPPLGGPAGGGENKPFFRGFQGLFPNRPLWAGAF